MSDSELICIYRAATVGDADVVTEWLQSNDVPAEIKNPHAVSTVYVPLAVAPKGVEVCVRGDDVAARATQLLAQHNEELRIRREQLAAAPPIHARCEECGTTSSFPAIQADSVQDCPRCGAHMDVVEE